MRASLLSPHAVVDLFNNLNLFYSVVTEFCTVENNPTMSAGPG
jgi:MOB kinase activator 1